MTSRMACCRRVNPVAGSGSSVTLGRPGLALAGAAGRCAPRVRSGELGDIETSGQSRTAGVAAKRRAWNVWAATSGTVARRGPEFKHVFERHAGPAMVFVGGRWYT